MEKTYSIAGNMQLPTSRITYLEPEKIIESFSMVNSMKETNRPQVMTEEEDKVLYEYQEPTYDYCKSIEC
jgi:hypothetical protein